MTTLPSLAERVRSGDARAMARAISLIEDEAPGAAALIRDIFPHTGRAYLVGVTGPPGAGKSTLVDRLTTETRHAGETVAVIAVDPTSPFTGGAILGDRVRMQAHAQDSGVFIRSMATRGHLGGLARATSDAALVFDAAGKSVVMIETVGVGQDEIDIVRTADVSVVVLVPGTGDDVQALKAGIMEIADVFVVNKSDREGADRVVTSIEANLGLQTFGEGEWRPPIIKTEATAGHGVAELWATILRFRAHSENVASGTTGNVASGSTGNVASGSTGNVASGTTGNVASGTTGNVASGTTGNVASGFSRTDRTNRTTRDRRLKARNEYRLRDLLTHRFMEHVEKDLLGPAEFESLVAKIAAREVDPYTAASDILSRALHGPPTPGAPAEGEGGGPNAEGRRLKADD